MRSFRHLNLSDRRVIYNMLKKDSNRQEIADAVGFDRSTISREINKNLGDDDYDPELAHKNYLLNRKKCGYKKQWGNELLVYIRDCIKLGLSPDSISGRITNFKPNLPNISHQTIYTWIIKGYLGKSLIKYLLFGKKGYKRSKQSLKGMKNKGQKRIDEMPENAKTGNELGHFQADTIHGAKQSGAIATFVDTKSKFLIAQRMLDKTSESYSKALKYQFADIENLKTILQDNGSEMANFQTDEKMLQCEIYFTYPGRPWEKALIENSNRLLRRFFPKRKSFSNITEQMILQAVNWINNLPRKSLGYRTAFEVFYDIEPGAFET